MKCFFFSITVFSVKMGPTGAAATCRGRCSQRRMDMDARMKNDLGSIVIDTNVIATYAGSVAVECFGIVGMASVNMKDGLVKLLRKENLEHGISVKVVDNKISLDFHVIVSYGVSIFAVADNLISNVKYKLEAFTGMEVEKIRIYVEGVRVID